MKRQQARPEGVRKAQGGVELVLGTRALMVTFALVGMVAVLLIGVAMGRSGGGAATAGSSGPPIQAAVTPQLPANLSPSTEGVNVAVQPNSKMRAPVSEQEAPIGDEPRLAIPELASTGYTYSFGKIGSNAKVAKTLAIKNIGKKTLEIKGTFSS